MNTMMPKMCYSALFKQEIREGMDKKNFDGSFRIHNFPFWILKNSIFCIKCIESTLWWQKGPRIVKGIQVLGIALFPRNARF